jgi:tetratricopeptide (TPR) repeat protein
MKLIQVALLSFILALAACSVPQYVSVPITYAPQRAFNPDSTTIVLINQFDAAQTGLTNKKKLDVIKAGAFSSLRFAEMQLKALSKVRVINQVDSTTFHLNTDSVPMIARRYRANYVLALKNFSADIVLDEVQSSIAYYNTNVTVEYTLYEDNGIYYKKLKGLANDPQSEGEYPGLLGSLIIHPTVKGNKASIVTSAQNATFNALQEYLPNTISHNRPLYTDGYLKQPVVEIMAGNFDKAILLLEPHLKDNDVKLASKAAYNLAVIYESQGNIDKAIELAQLSLNKDNNPYATSILGDLKTE